MSVGLTAAARTRMRTCPGPASQSASSTTCRTSGPANCVTPPAFMATVSFDARPVFPGGLVCGGPPHAARPDPRPAYAAGFPADTRLAELHRPQAVPDGQDSAAALLMPPAG